MTNIEGLDGNVVEDKSSVESDNLPDIAGDLEKKKLGVPNIARDIEQKSINRHIESSVSTKLSLAGDVKQEDLEASKSIFQSMWYYINDIDSSFTLGRAEAIQSTGKLIFDIAGVNEDDNARKILDNFMKTGKEVLAPKTTAGNIAEVIGQVGTGMAYTGGFNPLGATSTLGRIGANALQEATVAGVFFDEKSGNIFDVLKGWGVDNSVVDYISSKDDEDSSKARLKNALAGAGLSASLESMVVGLFSLAKGFKKGDEVLQENLGSTITPKPIEELPVTQTPQQIIEEHFEIVKNEAKKTIESLPIEKRIEQLDIGATKVVRNTGDDLVKQAEDIVSGVKAGADEVPLVNPKHLEVSTGTKELDDVLIALRGIEKDTPYRSQKNAMELAEKTLKDAMKDPNFSADKFVESVANEVKYQDVKTGMMMTTLSLVTKDLKNTSNKAFMNPDSVVDFLNLTMSLEKFNKITSHFTNYTGDLARGLGMLNFKRSSEKAVINYFKMLDTIDTEQSHLIFKKALEDGKIGQEVLDNIKNISEKAGDLKSVIDNYQDGWITKVMNVISEEATAGMLSGIPTMFISVPSNIINRLIDFGVDMNRFVISNATNSASKMQVREAKAILASQTYKTIYDAKASLKLLRGWAYGDDASKGIPKSFKDDDFDNNVFIRMYQDQPVHHKYISSEYIRGKDKGSQESAINTMINIYGKVTRSSFKIPSVIDDITKRGAFRTELIRQASALADVRKLPDDEYVKFLDDFVRANTELQLMKNNYGANFRPKTEWIEANKQFIGTSRGLTKYADEGALQANDLTLQGEIKGNMGKQLEVLNHNGLFRVLYPFKTITINSLDKAGEIAFPIVYKKWQSELRGGGFKKDIAIAKLAMSAELLIGTYALLESSVIVTGTYDPRESKAYSEAGAPPNSISMDGGKTYHDYRQYEPISTILSTFADLKNLYRRVHNQKEFLPKEEIDSLYSDAIGDLLMITASNIANKTFAKSLSDQLGVLMGTKDASVWLGNAMSSITPFSGLVQSTGRFFGDGVKYEPATFTDRIFKSYRFILDRPDLDSFGMEMDDIKYTPFLTKKVDTSDPKFESRKEMVRLGIMPEWRLSNINMEGVNVRLTGDEKYMANKLLNSDEIAYQDNMDALINKDEYKNAPNDIVRKEMLSEAKSIIIHNATELLKSKLQDRILTKVDFKLKGIERGTVDVKYSSIVKGITDGK